MSVPVRIFDGFAPDAAAVRDAVIAGGFNTQIGPDGAPYTGISRYAVPHWFDLISVAVGAPIVPRLSCFRVSLAGEVSPVWVHSDDICAQYASVLYLNPPEQCAGGTAFWRHRVHGYERLFGPDELAERGIEYGAYHEWMMAEWRRLHPWTQAGLVPMQFNRFITYPTSYFHSRYPFEGFGASPGDGRMIWVCFFDLA
jgi:hypothetical protein